MVRDTLRLPKILKLLLTMLPDNKHIFYISKPHQRRQFLSFKNTSSHFSVDPWRLYISQKFYLNFSLTGKKHLFNLDIWTHTSPPHLLPRAKISLRFLSSHPRQKGISHPPICSVFQKCFSPRRKGGGIYECSLWKMYQTKCLS